MACGSIEAMLAAVMALRTAYIKVKQEADPEFAIEADPTIATMMAAIADFHEHMRTR